MANGRVWAIKGVSDRTRAAVLEAAHGAGLTVGEWLDQILATAAAEALHPRPPAASREEVAELLAARLGPVEAAVGRLAERFVALEAKMDQQPGPASARSTRTQGQHPRGPRLRLPKP